MGGFGFGQGYFGQYATGGTVPPSIPTEFADFIVVDEQGRWIEVDAVERWVTVEAEGRTVTV
jgi:hypothetical protein